MKIRATPADFTVARVLADRLMTTCNPSEYWDTLDDLTTGQCVALDTIVFECHTCNHWFPMIDRREGDNGNWYCRECF